VHPGDELAERRQPSLRLAKRGVEMLPGARGVGGELSLGKLKVDHRRDELLLCSVMEITGESLTSRISVSENPARGPPIRVLTSGYLGLAQKNQSSALTLLAA
jgi:hypothetical protein